jgi:hypothetical protein
MAASVFGAYGHRPLLGVTTKSVFVFTQPSPFAAQGVCPTCPHMAKADAASAAYPLVNPPKLA